MAVHLSDRVEAESNERILVWSSRGQLPGRFCRTDERVEAGMQCAFRLSGEALRSGGRLHHSGGAESDSSRSAEAKYLVKEGEKIGQTEIQINFNQARVQARELEALAAEVRGMSGELTGMCRKLALSFQGDAAHGCRRDAEALQRMLQAAGHELSAEATQLRNAATRLYQAELQALAHLQEETS